MQNLAVHWHEGLFLRPHHLQAWDRHWHETQTASERWQSPYTYGLASITIDSDSLAAGFFQLSAVRAKMPEGTLIELMPGETSERIDLRAGLDETPSPTTIPLQGGSYLDVYLAVPRLQLGGTNVAENETQTSARFQQLQVHVPDEADGASVEPIIFRRVNATLLLSTDDLSGYDTLKIARIRRGRVGGAIAELDDRYIPPALSCNAWPLLSTRVLRPIHDMIMLKIELLAKLINDHSVHMDASNPGDLQRILMLQTLNQGAAALEVVNHSNGVHPWLAFLELNRICASLDLFSSKRSMQPGAPYDHDALGPLFYSLREKIESRIASVGKEAYQQRFFVGSGAGMQATVDPQWLEPGWRCVLGVRRGKLSAVALDKLLSPGVLDWKIGSARQVEMLFSKRAKGIELSPLRDVPKQLPSQSDWSFYEMSDSGPAWNDVVQTNGLGLRIREQMIDNSSELNGNTTLNVRIEEHRISLQFAVFAIEESRAP